MEKIVSQKHFSLEPKWQKEKKFFFFRFLPNEYQNNGTGVRFYYHISRYFKVVVAINKLSIANILPTLMSKHFFPDFHNSVNLLMKM